MAKKETVTLKELKTKQATIHIAGKDDLVLNKMGDRTERELIAKQKGKKAPKDEPNEWEDIITSIHWREPLGDIAPDEYSEEMMHDLLINNAPCISAHGLMEQLGKAVTRFKIDQYSTSFKAAVNIVADNGLIPIKFAEYELVEKLIPTKTASRVPVLAQLNTFHGWSADVHIDYVESLFGIEGIVQVFYLCGRSLGIGSGTSSEMGRFTVENVE